MEDGGRSGRPYGHGGGTGPAVSIAGDDNAVVWACTGPAGARTGAAPAGQIGVRSTVEVRIGRGVSGEGAPGASASSPARAQPRRALIGTSSNSRSTGIGASWRSGSSETRTRRSSTSTARRGIRPWSAWRAPANGSGSPRAARQGVRARRTCTSRTTATSLTPRRRAARLVRRHSASATTTPRSRRRGTFRAAWTSRWSPGRGARCRC